MPQVSPLSLVPNLHGSDGVPVPRVDVVNDNGKGSGLYAAVHIEGEIRVALCFRRFVQSGYHDDDGNLLRPNHSPEICYRVS